MPFMQKQIHSKFTYFYDIPQFIQLTNIDENLNTKKTYSFRLYQVFPSDVYFEIKISLLILALLGAYMYFN